MALSTHLEPHQCDLIGSCLAYRTDPFRETRPFQAPDLAWKQLQFKLGRGEEDELAIGIIG